MMGLVVAGVGRSGTSVATQLVATLGLRVPSGADLMRPNNGNPTGYWESTSLARLNDDLLRRWGSNWWQPPGVVTSDMVDALDELVGPATAAFLAAFPNQPWVWKDPRLTVLLPFWERILGRQPVLFPHRDPREVAHSVSMRDGVPLVSSLAIWERHTRLALIALRGRQVAVVSYDRLRRDPRGWRSDVAVFCSDAGLPVHELASSAEDIVVPRDTGYADRIQLSAAQESLYEIVRSLEGFHSAFSRVDPPVEDEVVAMRLAEISIPVWTLGTGEIPGTSDVTGVAPRHIPPGPSVADRERDGADST